jgi:menaquinone-specific isochorismate synthase
VNWFQTIQTLINRVKEQKHPLQPMVIRLEIPILSVDLIAWLFFQKAIVKLYWSARDEIFAVAGIGIAHEVTGTDLNEPQLAQLVSSLTEDSSLCYVGGVRFIPLAGKSLQWQGFDGFRFILPLIEIKQQGNTFILACHINALDEYFFAIEKQKIVAALEKMQTESRFAPLDNFQPIEVVSSSCLPDKEQWQLHVSSVLSSIAEKKLDKVVLAEEITKICASPIEAVRLLAYLKEQIQLAYHFYLQFDESKAFLGASPERLYSRVKSRIQTEAQAGTRIRGVDLEDDERLAVELRGSKKDRLEQGYVLDEIEGILQILCSNYTIVNHREIVKFSHVQHLRSRLSGILKESVNDAQILKMLHPTSAVCGLPKQLSLQKIQEFETFDRGYYAGAIGYLSGTSSEFAVGIRSALIHENQLFAYAGAGIVKGSKAEEEWQEIQNKMNLFARICHDRSCSRS